MARQRIRSNKAAALKVTCLSSIRSLRSVRASTGSARTGEGRALGFYFSTVPSSGVMPFAAALAASDTALGETISPLAARRSEEHTSEPQSLMRTSYAAFCLKKKKKHEDARIT